MQKFLKYKAVFWVLVAIAGGICGTWPDKNFAASPSRSQPAAGEDSAVQGDVDIALHKALYEFKLASVEPGASLNDIKGKMYYEQDDACDAWTTDHRLTTEYHYAERPVVTDTGHYAAYESKDQHQFSFSSEREENGETTEKLRGSIEKSADGTAKAVYSRPDDLKYDLPAGYFLPTAHTIKTIYQARSGAHFFSAVMFDGTDADGPVEIGTFIGQKVTADEIKEIAHRNKKIDISLLTPEAWHVRMAVFPLKDTETSVPAYEMELILHGNGVVSRVLVDYKSFQVEQDLTALEKLPQKKCH